MGFLFVDFQAICLYLFNGFDVCLFCLFFCWQEHPEVVHIPDIILYMQLLFGVMIHWVQKSDTSDLDHLRSWVVSGLASILVSQYSTRHFGSVRVCIAVDLIRIRVPCVRVVDAAVRVHIHDVVGIAAIGRTRKHILRLQPTSHVFYE